MLVIWLSNIMYLPIAAPTTNFRSKTSRYAKHICLLDFQRLKPLPICHWSLAFTINYWTLWLTANMVLIKAYLSLVWDLLSSMILWYSFVLYYQDALAPVRPLQWSPLGDHGVLELLSSSLSTLPYISKVCYRPSP